MRTLNIILITLAILGCQQQYPSESTEVTTEEVGSFQEQGDINLKLVSDEPVRSHIIKNANYRFRVEDVNASTKNIEAMIRQAEGYVADMNLEANHSEISNTLVIRVPARNFESLLETLGKEATFTDYKRISTQDVTEEFIDIQTRLRTKKEVRDRYIDILRNKAKTVDDVLKAEEQIRILQEEIESREGRLKYLQDRVSVSTINLEIYQPLPYAERPQAEGKPYLIRLNKGLTNGWEMVTGFSLLLVNLWPFIVVGSLLWWKRKWIRAKLFS
jgi:hypothetical protein